MASSAYASTAAMATPKTPAALPSSNSSSDELVTAFRQKAQFMKDWKPTSAPSNRDRLELYAWHKQAISGDAPASMLQTNSNMTLAEKAKYNAWRSKAGTDTVTAMRSYMFESERQVRVYGGSQSVMPQPQQQSSRDAAAPPTSTTQSRGLAAIPLLCAAASEDRSAYLRRLQSTPTAWWRRQEPLSATPGTIAALPETVLLYFAAAVEGLSLAANTYTNSIPQAACAMLQSGLWPLHNALLAVWMGYILLASVVTAAVELSKTVLLGSRRTGRTLDRIWGDDVLFLKLSCDTIADTHQPLSARVVGLLVQPLPLAVALLCHVPALTHPLTQACAFVAFTIVTAWYWVMVLPWVLVVVFLGVSLLLGNCFALIELAAHI